MVTVYSSRKTPVESGDEMTVRDALRILKEERILLFAIVALTIVGAVTAGRIMPQDVSATAQVRVYQDDRAATLLALGDTPAPVDHDVLMDTQIRLATNPAVARRVVERLGLADTPGDVLQRISVSALGRSTMLTIEAQAPDADSAVALADTWIAEYLAWTAENTAADLAAASSALAPRITAAQQRLAETEARIKTGGHTKEADTALATAASDYEQLLAGSDRLQTLASLDSAPIAVVSSAIAEDRSEVISIAMDVLKGLAVGLVLGILLALLRHRTPPAAQPS